MKKLITAKEAKALSDQNAQRELSEHMIDVINASVKEACSAGKSQCTMVAKSYTVCEYLVRALATYGYKCEVGGLGNSGWTLLITW